jgi:dihydroorotate dehydrogenase
MGDSVYRIREYLKYKIVKPLLFTIVSEYEDIEARINAGATILNVSGARRTAYIVRKIREKYPDFPIIATGGPSDSSILETIQAGANAITYTPPITADILNEIMIKYRTKYEVENEEK